jgi:hypothetical protein
MTPFNVVQALINLGAASLLVYWVIPVTIYLSCSVAIVLLLAPQAWPVVLFENLEWQDRLLTVAVIGLVIGSGLAAFQTLLYRSLSGYYLPARLRVRLIARQRRLRLRIREALLRTAGIERPILLEHFKRFPVDEATVAPTRLANAIRAMERYGWEQFQLDSSSFYEELSAVCPEGIRNRPNSTKASVDMFVALTSFSIILSVAVTGIAVASNQSSLAILPITCLSLALLFYRLAVLQCDKWRSAMQAMINLGRKPLAEALGYTLPPEPKAEREFWRTVSIFLKYPYHEDVSELVSRIVDRGQVAAADRNDAAGPSGSQRDG